MSLAKVPAQARYAARLPPGPSIREIQDAVCEAYGVSRHDLLSQRRQAALVTARHVAMWLSRWHTRLSYPRIGMQFGREGVGMDHTSVMHAVNRIEERMRDDDVLAARVRRLAALLERVDDDARRTG